MFEMFKKKRASPKEELYRELARWAINGRTGISSLTIAGVCGLGEDVKPHYPPADFYDFERCMLLLERIPYLRNNLSSLGSKFQGWKPFIEAWEVLEKLYYLSKEDNKHAKELNEMLRYLNKVAY